MAFMEDNYWTRAKKQAVPANNMGFVGPMFSIAQRQAMGDTPDFNTSAGNFANPRIKEQLADAAAKAISRTPERSVNAAERAINERMLAEAPGKVTDIAKKILGIGNSLVDEYNRSPEGVFERLRSQFPDYQYTGRSAAEMANSEFAPQFQILDQAAKALSSRYNTNKGELSGLWNALSNDVVKQRGENQQIYSTANQNIGNMYSEAAQSTTQNMNNATKQMGDVLALLGQNEAAPELLQDKQELLAQNLGRVNAAKASAQELNQNLGANAYAFDTSRIGTTRQAGLGAQQDLMQQFFDLQNENDMRRLDVQGQKGEAQNRYEMMIQELLQGGSVNRDKAINDAFQQIMTSQNQNEQNLLSRDRLGLDEARLRLDEQRLATYGNQNDDLNPYEIIRNDAAKYFANDPSTGRRLVDQINDVGIENPNQSLQDYFDILEQEYPGFLNQPYARELAYDYFYALLQDRNRQR